MPEYVERAGILRKDKKLLYRAICTFGPEAQIKKTFEEMGELQEAICKVDTGRDTLEHLAEEVADVQIMLDQVILMYGIEETVVDWREEKLGRLREKIEEPEQSSEKNTSESLLAQPYFICRKCGKMTSLYSRDEQGKRIIMSLNRCPRCGRK